MGSFNTHGDYIPRTLIGPRESNDPKVRLGFALCVAAASLLALLAVAPFAWMLITSVRPSSEIFEFPARLWPSEFRFSTYTEALKRLPFLRYLGNSLFTCLAAVFLQLLFSACAAYALSRLKPRFGRLMLWMIVATLMIPFESLVIPLYMQMRSFPFGAGPGVNLLNTYWVLVLPAVVSAFNVFMLKGFFDRLPEEVLFTARLDGCSEWMIFFKFVLPMSRPLLTVLGIFGFISVWNGFFWPLVALNDPDIYTLMLGIQKLLETGEPWNIVMAAVTLTTVPTIIIFLFFQRWIMRGMAFSGLQG
jgi:multiple sugar transport system permease protein